LDAMPRRKSPFSALFDMMSLYGEANAVIALRAAGLATGATAGREISLMLTEKVDALFRANAAAAKAILAGKAETALPAATAVYTRTVRANRRRLSR
jgi:hypothetical protein